MDELSIIKEFCDNPTFLPQVSERTMNFINKAALMAYNTPNCRKELAEQMLNAITPTIEFNVNPKPPKKINGFAPRINPEIMLDTWRKDRHIDVDGWEYDIIPEGTILFRGDDSKYGFHKRATYYTPLFKVSNMYINKTKKGYIQVLSTTKDLKTFRIDSLNNINKILQLTYNENKKLYRILLGFFGQGKHVKDNSLPLPPHVERIGRVSSPKEDFVFANWLCDNGFQGYSAGFIISLGSFPDEVMICDGLGVLRLEKLIHTKRLVLEEDYQRLKELI